MPNDSEPLTNWPPSIANWHAFERQDPWVATQEFPLFTDAWITGEIEAGPYRFLNTVPLGSNNVRPAVVLRYSVHKEWEHPSFRKTDAELYHAGSPPQELAALASLAMGIRLRAGHSIRCFEPNGDPLGTPTESGDHTKPYFHSPAHHNVPSAAQGQHPLTDLTRLNCLPTLSQTKACAIVRAARLYQDALWLAESEPELTWLLLVSALETAANEWQKKTGDNINRLRESKPKLYEFLEGLKDLSIMQTVAEHIADSLGITHKFVEFVLQFLPAEPQLRPPEYAQFKWESKNWKKALRIIYGYRSKALHDGRPYPAPMCEPPARLDPSWQAPAERMIALGSSQRGGVWLQDDIPMNLHFFEYITRNVLLKWWQALGRQ